MGKISGFKYTTFNLKPTKGSHHLRNVKLPVTELSMRCQIRRVLHSAILRKTRKLKSPTVFIGEDIQEKLMFL